MSSKLNFKFTLKITPPLDKDLPPEVVKAHADGFTLMAAWRRYRGFSQKEISKRAGIPAGTYSNHERKMNKPPKHTLKKIAEALQVDVHQLIENG